MDQYKTYLATKVLNEDLHVNYRQLSRALKVHSHLAKQMLYEFHQKQTSKKPGSIHATYLITGTTRAEPTPSAALGRVSQLDDDTVMDSSPFPSSYPEPDPAPSFVSDDAEPAEEEVHTTTVLLVREEELEEAKQEFEEIQSIFVYSLEPGPQKDFYLLTQCNREVTQQFWTEDPVDSYKTYGIIQNLAARRRTGKRPPPPAAAAAAITSKTAPKPTAAAAKDTVQAAKKDAPKPTTTTTRPPTTKRQSSDLFKSFAKTQPPKLKTEGTSTPKSASASATNSPITDEPMQGMSEDEADEADQEMADAEAAAQAKRAEASRKAKKEKEEKLRQMMDEEDEDEDMADAGAEDVEVVDEAAALDQPVVEEKKEEEVVVSGGRRRGRRRVMKRKTFKDEDGYLVTKEEAAWESFSEDEPEPKKTKISAAPAKPKKGAAPAKGQGNLMNFFKKK